MGFWQIVQESHNAGIVADLLSGHEEAQGASDCNGDSVKFCVDAAFGAADQPPGSLFNPQVRCRAVRLQISASIMTGLDSALAEAGPSIMRTNTRISPHPFQRLYDVLYGPKSFGAYLSNNRR